MKFSIVTISFNQAEFLERAILSVLNQDHDDIEYIVVDPGSTDGSRDIIERYRDRIDRIVFKPDRGAAEGLNNGMEGASGEILGFLNSDDVLMPGAISQIVHAFQANPDIDLVTGHAYIIDATNRPFAQILYRQISLAGFCIRSVPNLPAIDILPRRSLPQGRWLQRTEPYCLGYGAFPELADAVRPVRRT